MSIAQHSSKNNEHYTPQEYIDAARACMGSIDLDPATTAEVNARTVQAVNFLDQAVDGLSCSWFGNVFLNPPGGLIGRKSSAAVWWTHLVREWHAKRVNQAIFFGFTLEILRSTQAKECVVPAGVLPFCIPRKRVAFLGQDFNPQTQPSHANVIVYLPPTEPAHMSGRRFQSCFNQFGTVIIPARL